MSETSFEITAIEPQKKRANRFNIYLDDAFAFGLDQETVFKYHLHVGDTINEETIDKILTDEELVKAKNKTLAWLSYRMRSVKEIRDRLKDHGYHENTVRRVVDDFLRTGLLDDKVFASAFVQTRMIQKPVSRRLLRLELKQKGISESVAEVALDEAFFERDEVSVAADLIRRRAARYRGLEDRQAAKKIGDFLMRRGFGWEIILQVTRDFQSDQCK